MGGGAIGIGHVGGIREPFSGEVFELSTVPFG
jgi:hypothetical protein